MRRRGSLVVVYGAPGVLVIAGCVLLFLSWGEPRYADPNWEYPHLFADISTDSARRAATESYYADQWRNMTRAAHRADLGRVLLGLGSSLAVLLGSLGITRIGDLGALTTPSRRNLFVLANLAWLAFVPAQWLWLVYTARRGDYPPWGDIILIPGLSYLMAFVVLLPVVNLGVFLCARRADLPCRIVQPLRSFRALLSGALLLLPAALISVLALDAVDQRDPFTLAVVAPAFYAVMCAWAAAASPRPVTRRPAPAG